MAPVAGIVLAGGRSSRMGAEKAALDWGGVPLLVHVVGRLAAAVDVSVLVVARPGQVLPALPAGVARIDDAVADQGPLRGLAGGLAAAGAAGAEIAIAVTVDAPFLAAAVVTALAAALAGDPAAEIAAIDTGRRTAPFPAAYRPGLAAAAHELLDAGERRARALVTAAPVHRIDATDLLAIPAVAAADPELRSLTDLDDPTTYTRLRPAGSAPRL